MFYNRCELVGSNLNGDGPVNFSEVEAFACGARLITRVNARLLVRYTANCTPNRAF